MNNKNFDMLNTALTPRQCPPEMLPVIHKWHMMYSHNPRPIEDILDMGIDKLFTFASTSEGHEYWAEIAYYGNFPNTNK